MRVLVLTNLYPPRVLGGYEILCGQVSEALARRGHAVEVLTSDDGPPASAPDPPHVHRLLRTISPFGQAADFSRARRLRLDRRNARAARAFLRGRRFDVAFAWSQLRLTLGALRAVQRAGVPTALTFNDETIAAYAPARLAARPRALVGFLLDRGPLAATTLAGIDLRHSAAISRCLRQRLARAGVAVRHTEVIYQGIPLERFPLKDTPGQLHRPLRLFYAGQLHADKGVHTLLTAAHALATDDAAGGGVTLALAGDGLADYRARLERLAAGPAAVRFLGRVAHDALPALYREHDVLVFPSEWEEPFGLTHLEAMASGTPVVSTTEGGPAEFLRHEDNALVFRAGDAADLAAQLRRLRDDPGLARRLAAAGRDVVQQRFTLARYVDDLEALLARAAGGGR